MQTILVISSDEVLRTDLRAALPRRGRATLDAADSRRGLELFGRESPDLAILCLDLAAGDALETLLQLRLLSPSLPMIAIAAEQRPGHEKRMRAALSFGADAALPKPVTPSVLFDTIDRLLGDA